MRNEHPLLKRARKYRRRDVDLAPAGCFYDEDVGAWRFIETCELWHWGTYKIGFCQKNP